MALTKTHPGRARRLEKTVQEELVPLGEKAEKLEHDLGSLSTKCSLNKMEQDSAASQLKELAGAINELSDLVGEGPVEPLLLGSWANFPSSLPDSNEPLGVLNRQCELTLPRPTAAPTATQLRVCLTLHYLWRQARHGADRRQDREPQCRGRGHQCRRQPAELCAGGGHGAVKSHENEKSVHTVCVCGLFCFLAGRPGAWDNHCTCASDGSTHVRMKRTVCWQPSTCGKQAAGRHGEGGARGRAGAEAGRAGEGRAGRGGAGEAGDGGTRSISSST